jgi:hypothetical protein
MQFAHRQASGLSSSRSFLLIIDGRHVRSNAAMVCFEFTGPRLPA